MVFLTIPILINVSSCEMKIDQRDEQPLKTKKDNQARKTDKTKIQKHSKKWHRKTREKQRAIELEDCLIETNYVKF